MNYKELIMPIIIIVLVVGGIVAGVSLLFTFDGGGSGMGEIEDNNEDDNKDNNKDNNMNNSIVVIKTNYGEIKLELFNSDAPKTTANFIKLSEQGFYDGTKFHRVIKGFMIQGGDPKSKEDSLIDEWGTGGPGYVFEDEIHVNNNNAIGTIAMANSGADTNGSQFFINTANNNYLDTKHTVFGKIIEGLDIVTKIENVDTNDVDRPISPVIIESIIINK